jgi:hypothetical protein
MTIPPPSTNTSAPADGENAWRVVRFGVAFQDISFTNTYVVPNDGRDIEDLTLAELKAYPALSGIALLDGVVSDHARQIQGDGSGASGRVRYHNLLTRGG